MKAVFVNGSPRKAWNTATLLQEAQKGAADAGADTEFIHLNDYTYKGCQSCFACKLKNNRTNGVCAVRDDLKPILERIMEADVLVLGSPIYFDNMTAEMLAFYERLLFPVLNYKVPVDGKMVRTLPKAKKVGMIFTMNCPAHEMEKVSYTKSLPKIVKKLGMLLSDEEASELYSCNTWQFTDYSKYDVNMFDVEDRARQKEEVFPLEMKKAYEMGKELVRKAGEK